MKKYWKILIPILTMLLMLSLNTPVLAKESTAQTSISVENIVDKSSDNITFSIVLESIDPVKTVEEISIDGAGKGSFSPLTFTTVGQYAYRVYQKTTESKDYQADTTIFDVLIFVTYDKEGTLVAKVVSRKAGEDEKSSITFRPKSLVKPLEPSKRTLPKQSQTSNKPLPLTGEAKGLLGILGVAFLVLLLAFYVKGKINK